MKTYLALLALLTISSSAFAQGDKAGGGGNITEGDLTAYMMKIDRYLQSPEGKQTFPEVVEYDLNNPRETFHDVLLSVKPVVQDNEVKDAFGKSRDCVSYNTGKRYFVCDRSKLPNNNLDSQPSYYRIVLHELFVQTGIERPIDTNIPSDYSISFRITQNVHLETYQEWVPGKSNTGCVIFIDYPRIVASNLPLQQYTPPSELINILIQKNYQITTNERDADKTLRVTSMVGNARDASVTLTMTANQAVITMVEGKARPFFSINAWLADDRSAAYANSTNRLNKRSWDRALNQLDTNLEECR